MQPSVFCPHVLSSLTFSLLSARLCSWASSSDGPVSTCSPSGVGPGAASGDPEPPSAPVPKELPAVPVTDTSRTDWENAHTTRSSAARGAAGWKSVTTQSAAHDGFWKSMERKMLDRTAEEVLSSKTKTRCTSFFWTSSCFFVCLLTWNKLLMMVSHQCFTHPDWKSIL